MLQAATMTTTTTYSRKLPTGDLRLIVGANGRELALPIHLRDFVLGRRVDEQYVDVDLTSHGAYRLGVSRNHLRVQITPQGVRIMDLNSRHGSTLNGQPLRAGNATMVSNGDVIMLGAMRLIVSFAY